MACFHACLNELPSELRGFAFKSTDLIYIHCVSNENFTVTVKDFTFVSLVCREVHISYVQSICKRRRSLIPATSFPGSLILPPPGASEERPWFGLVTCVPESGTLQLNC